MFGSGKKADEETLDVRCPRRSRRRSARSRQGSAHADPQGGRGRPQAGAEGPEGSQGTPQRLERDQARQERMVARAALVAGRRAGAARPATPDPVTPVRPRLRRRPPHPGGVLHPARRGGAGPRASSATRQIQVGRLARLVLHVPALLVVDTAVLLRPHATGKSKKEFPRPGRPQGHHVLRRDAHAADPPAAPAPAARSSAGGRPVEPEDASSTRPTAGRSTAHGVPLPRHAAA